MPQQASSRFLIVRLTAIGDVVHTLPVLCALRKAQPDAYIAWVVEGRCGAVLRDHPAVDDVIAVQRRWLKSPRAIHDLRHRLQALNCDTVIDVQGLSKSSIAARMSGGRRRIGFAGEAGREISKLLNNDLVMPTKTHIIERNLELLKPLGITSPAVEYGLPHWEDDALEIEQYVCRAGVAHGFALINSGAGWASKLWPPVRYAEVARHLGRVHRLPSVVAWGNPSELELAKEIVGYSGGHARLAPDTSLTGLATLARRARIGVAADTGPLHLTVAVGTPSVGLFGPMSHERNGPYGPQHISIQNARIEGGSRARRRANNSTMLAIHVREVCEACDTLLARQELSHVA